MSPKEIYLVTVGEFSEFRIDSAFSTHENATSYIKEFKKESECVEINVIVIDESIPFMLSGKKVFVIEIGSEGEPKCYKNKYPISTDMEIDYNIWSRLLYITIWANDSESAIVTSKSIRDSIISAGMWGNIDFINSING